jgi:mannose-6-phosphate isomerase-like protein (cupin superfamily)
MRRFTLRVLGVLLLMSPAATFGQGDWGPPVVDITKADQAAVYKNVTDPTKNLDQAILIADMGAFNIPIDEQYRVTPNPGPNGTMPFHYAVTEIYYVTEGSGTFVTATGPMTDVTSSKYSKDDTYKTLETGTNPGTGPGGNAVFHGPTKTRKLQAGDIVIVPPYTGHYFSQIDDHIRFLNFRVDPQHFLPAGYVNPALKSAGRTKP